jgi:hypothetical protein
MFACWVATTLQRLKRYSGPETRHSGTACELRIAIPFDIVELSLFRDLLHEIQDVTRDFDGYV